jgi:cell wall assembly regulator SMI1
VSVRSDPRLLDDALLDELEGRWRELGAPIAKALRPGLSDEQMDVLTAPFGVRLPREARRWWAWHDGATAAPGREPELIGPGISFLPLVDAVTRREMIKGVLRDAVGEQIGPGWKQTWLPLNSSKYSVVIDCQVAFEDPVPVYSFSFEFGATREPGCRSIGELVTIWIGAIDRGAWSFNRAEGRWEYDWERLDPDVESIRLA